MTTLPSIPTSFPASTSSPASTSPPSASVPFLSLPGPQMGSPFGRGPPKELINQRGPSLGYGYALDNIQQLMAMEQQQLQQQQPQQNIPALIPWHVYNQQKMSINQPQVTQQLPLFQQQPQQSQHRLNSQGALGQVNLASQHMGTPFQAAPNLQEHNPNSMMNLDAYQAGLRRHQHTNQHQMLRPYHNNQHISPQNMLYQQRYHQHAQRGPFETPAQQRNIRHNFQKQPTDQFASHHQQMLHQHQHKQHQSIQQQYPAQHQPHPYQKHHKTELELSQPPGTIPTSSPTNTTASNCNSLEMRMFRLQPPTPNPNRMVDKHQQQHQLLQQQTNKPQLTFQQEANKQHAMLPPMTVQQPFQVKQETNLEQIEVHQDKVFDIDCEPSLQLRMQQQQLQQQEQVQIQDCPKDQSEYKGICVREDRGGSSMYSTLSPIKMSYPGLCQCVVQGQYFK